MQVTQKSLYAVRAVFELAQCIEQGPKKIADIAKAQAIPPRFLESILSQLKQAGFVESYRGNDGGYVLIPSPKELTVGQVMSLFRDRSGQLPALLTNPGLMDVLSVKIVYFLVCGKKYMTQFWTCTTIPLSTI